MRTIQTYFKLAFAGVRSQMQRPASFWMNTVGNLIASGGSFVIIWALFASFGKLGQWSMAEIAVLYGIVNSAYALAEGVGRGFERFNQLVKTGDFDRVLLRPRGTLFQILSSKMEAARVGRLIQAVGALWLGLAAMPQVVGPGQIALILLCIVGGMLLFLGLSIDCHRPAARFGTVESIEVFNVLTFGGISAAAGPLDAFRKWLRDFFLYMIPIGFINLPALRLSVRQGAAVSLHGRRFWLRWRARCSLRWARCCGRRAFGIIAPAALDGGGRIG